MACFFYKVMLFDRLYKNRLIGLARGAVLIWLLIQPLGFLAHGVKVWAVIIAGVWGGCVTTELDDK